jgi:DNA topoisomerase-1
MTQIERLKKMGILRTGSPQQGFRYKRPNRKRVSSQDLSRIKRLRIPPAWTEVVVNSSSQGRLQAVGLDRAGRWQYIYHEHHTRTRAKIKYRRLIHFMEDLPKMRTTVARHLRQPDLGRERILACILRILSTCFLRPGSEVYASENGSYGIATLRPEHVLVRGDLIQFDFPGKSGVRQYRELRDRQVARVLRAIVRSRKAEVFKYQSENGEFVDVKRRHINEYIKETMGRSFSAKDFRTWAGTLVCACALANAGSDSREKPQERKKKIAQAIKVTAQTLGNTPAVCRSSYICPEVLASFAEGKILTEHFKTPDEFISYRGTKLHPAEVALLSLLK